MHSSRRAHALMLVRPVNAEPVSFSRASTGSNLSVRVAARCCTCDQNSAARPLPMAQPAPKPRSKPSLNRIMSDTSMSRHVRYPRRQLGKRRSEVPPDRGHDPLGSLLEDRPAFPPPWFDPDAAVEVVVEL